MPEARAASFALVKPSHDDTAPATSPIAASDRRAFSRLTPAELQSRLTARHKYGDAVTIVDLSAGGALLETQRIVRPDTDLALEIFDAHTRDVSHVVSRVLRARVAGVKNGVVYRAACVFKRPLSHPVLLEASAPVQPPVQTETPDYLKLELALKTIVEGYFKRPSGSGSAGRWRDATSLLEALVRLRAASERRRDPIDRQLALFLSSMIPALQRHEPVDAVLAQLHDQLSQHLPLLTIRANSNGEGLAHDRERVTLNMCADAAHVPIAVTAEFPPGFCLDAGQFRLLKMTAYLVGLVGNWNHESREAALAPTAEERELPKPAAISEPAIPQAASAAATVDPSTADSGDLPFGWHRIVVRYVDGPLLRGYSNDFYPERVHLHLCPTVACAAAERLLVPLSRLKAVFFVKSLHGNKERIDDQVFDHAPRGRKVQVTFRDGEVMVGSTLNFKPNAYGFFLQPANSQSNNIRIYVITPSIQHTRFV